MANEKISYIGQVMGEPENKEAKIINVDEYGSLITAAKKTPVIFHNQTEVIGLGAIVDVGTYRTLTISITGTSTARTVAFYGMLGNDTLIPLTGNASNGRQYRGTDENNEIWTFDITGLDSVAMDVVYILGGDVTVQGNMLS